MKQVKGHPKNKGTPQRSLPEINNSLTIGVKRMPRRRFRPGPFFHPSARLSACEKKRNESEREKKGGEKSTAHGDPERPEEKSRKTVNEGEGEKGGHRGQSPRHVGTRDLKRPFERRPARGVSFLPTPRYAFRNHNRVIDDHPHGQSEGRESHNVERESEPVQEGHRTQHGNGNRGGHDKSGTNRTGEEKKNRNRKHGAEKKILPGRYTITSNISRLELLRRLRNGSFDYVWITLPEGLTAEDAIKILAQKSGRSKAEFERLLKDSSFLVSLPFSPTDIEGYLFPETYKVPYNAEPDYLVRTIVGSLAEYLNDSLIARMNDLGFSVRQLLTFASLIEAETAASDEMPLISAVFHNRLKKNMRLQCDPTVIYALGGLDRPLRLKDLKYDSPYNTYVHRGLPPGPINSPGAKAILAALYPAQSDYLFFVADANGKHIFSKTNAQHEKNRREIKRKKRAMKFNTSGNSSSQND